jgi:two-component system sensor histidine kinase RegB
MGIGLTLVSTTLEQMGAHLEMELGPRWTQARIDWPRELAR